VTATNGIRYTVDDGVARIALARPDVSNAVDLATATAFGAAVDRAGEDPEVRVVLVTGDGARFCAGGDVASMAAAADPSAYLQDLADELDGALQRLGALDKPVVAAVQGAAAGAGLAVVLACDVVVSGRGTKFLTAYAGVGLTPDCGLSWLLPRAVGQQRALELALTGRVLTAEEARDWGLVTTVVDDAELEEQATVLAVRLATAPPFALGQARRLIRSSWTVSRAESGADEARTIARAVTTPEAQALVARFAGR
jgi:2-(1,2-epoxy-1,2-dihydrophenyl)acetyl-CoA isomerase